MPGAVNAPGSPPLRVCHVAPPRLPLRTAVRHAMPPLWGTDISGFTRSQESLANGFGPIVSQGRDSGARIRVVPSWVRGELLAEWAGAGNEKTRTQAVHSFDPVLPRDTLGHRNQMRISHQDCRKISSVGSLLLRYTSLSYTHVVSHGRIYKA
jgi:hypothetical protein